MAKIFLYNLQDWLKYFWCAADNIAGFQNWYSVLTEDEKAKLNALAP